jgi:hypothetical protein
MTLKNAVAIAVLCGAVTAASISRASAGQTSQSAKSPESIGQTTETVTLHVDEVDDESKTTIDRAGEVDAIIRCRVQGGHVKAGRKTVPPGVARKYSVDVFTEHAVKVLEVLRGDARLAAEGQEMRVAQSVGEVVIEGVRVKRDEPDYPVFAPSEEYVLFLQWDSSRGVFSVVSSSDAFRIEHGAITSPGVLSYARSENGKPADDFVATLRSLAPGRRLR